MCALVVLRGNEFKFLGGITKLITFLFTMKKDRNHPMSFVPDYYTKKNISIHLPCKFVAFLTYTNVVCLKELQEKKKWIGVTTCNNHFPHSPKFDKALRKPILMHFPSQEAPYDLLPRTLTPSPVKLMKYI
jgi:hypothetical protein